MIQVLKQNQNRYYTPALAAAIGAPIVGGVAGLGVGKLLADLQASAMRDPNRLQALSSIIQGASPPPQLQEIQLSQYGTPDLFTSVGTFTPQGYTPELYTPAEFQLAGRLTPEAMNPTELRNILSSPEYLQSQKDVLRQYQDLSTQGLSAIDRAALAEIQNEIATQERGQREAILQNMAQRGMSGSGAELAANLLAQQQASQTASLEGQRIASQAQQARLQALQNVAQLGGQLGETEYERALNQARAQDVINQFNAQNRFVAQSENIKNLQNLLNLGTQAKTEASQFGALQKTEAAKYLAGMQNLSEQQRLEREQQIRNLNIEEANKIRQANVELQNRQKLYNLGELPTQQNRMRQDYNTALAGSIAGQAQTQAKQAQNRFNMMTQLFGTGLQTGGTLGAAAIGKG